MVPQQKVKLKKRIEDEKLVINSFNYYKHNLDSLLSTFFAVLRSLHITHRIQHVYEYIASMHLYAITNFKYLRLRKKEKNKLKACSDSVKKKKC